MRDPVRGAELTEAAPSWRPRPGWGLGVAIVLLTAWTAGILAVGGSTTVTLASVVLLYLVVVVIAAVIGGTWPGVAAAVASDVLVNWFFIPPFHTLAVERRDNLVALTVYVLVAVTVSVLVNVAATQRAAAVRSGLEARLLARIAAESVAAQSLERLLEDLRDTFGFTSLALWEAGEPVEHAGPPFTDAPTLRVDAGNSLELVAQTSETVGENRALLARLAGGAARTLEAQRLAAMAARGRQLAEVDRLRTAILRAVGHDLRTPLASIKVAAATLNSPDITVLDTDRGELVVTIVESAERLDELIENLLALSRLQAGVLSAQLRPVALDEIVARTALTVGAAQVVVDVPEDLPRVAADPGLLDRVIANLVDNAIRAGAGNPVSLRAVAGPDTVSLAVIDHGPGVPALERERIFAPFQRLDDRSTQGRLGLGLAIARGFTDAMGGRLTASATHGGGLTMTIELAQAHR